MPRKKPPPLSPYPITKSVPAPLRSTPPPPRLPKLMTPQMVQRVQEEREREGVARVEEEERVRERKGVIVGLVGKGGGVYGGRAVAGGPVSSSRIGGGSSGGSHCGGTERGRLETETGGGGVANHKATQRDEESGVGSWIGTEGIDCGNAAGDVTVGRGEPRRKKKKQQKLDEMAEVREIEKADRDRFRVAGDVTAWMNGFR